MNRREAIKNSALGGLGACFLGSDIIKRHTPHRTIKDQINHSVCRWCYSGIPLEKFAEHCVDIGIESIELLNPDEWDVVQKKGLTCAISNGSALGITKGFNDPKHHKKLREDFSKLIPLANEKGISQIICFSGNRNGISDEEGIEHSAMGLDPILKMAEKYNIQISMELLNSKVDHADYQCDRTSWGVTLVEKLGSPNFKLLYDIYHMQIMEGDVIRTIQENKDYIGHYHTGGVPGRNEIDESQELYYPAIMKAIADTGFDGFVAQEFIPKRDPISSLQQGIQICDI